MFVTLLFVIVQPLNHGRLCDPMDYSMPGFPVFHYLPEFAQTHAHWVNDAIQSSYPLPLPFPPALKLAQHQGFFPNGWALHIRCPKYWSFSISPSNKYSGLISFRIDWFDLLSVQGTLLITICLVCILHVSFSIIQQIYWAPTMYQTLFWNLGEQWKKTCKNSFPHEAQGTQH